MKYIFTFIILFFFWMNPSVAASQCASLLTEFPRAKIKSDIEIRPMMSRANDEFRSRDYLNSQASLKAILAFKPNDIIALNLLSAVQLNLGLISDARKTKEAVITLENRFNESTYFTYAEILILNDSPDLSIQYLSAILSENSKHSGALGLMARAYLMLGQLELAKTYIDEKGQLGINDPQYQLLLFEYYFKRGKDKADFYKKAYGVARNMEHSHKPKKDQVLVPRSYRKALALKAKALVAMNESVSDLKQALKDIRIYESYNQFPSNWSLLLQAEILFKMGQISESRDLLMRLLKEAGQRDLLVLSALLQIETQGQNINVDSEFLNQILDQLTPQELVEVLKLSRDLDWNYVAPELTNLSGRWFNTRIVNQFWYSQDVVLLPASNFISKATSTPKRVVRRRGFRN